MLDAASLQAERRRFFLAARGGVWFPAAGVVFWGLLGAAGFRWSARTWCVAVLAVAVVATPVAVVFFRWLVSRLQLKSPLATLILPALLPVALSLGMAAAALRSDPSLVPLALVIGLAGHWPAVGWLFDTAIFNVHAVIRVGVAVTVWFLLPDGRFTWLPLSIAAVYALTALWILEELRRRGTAAGSA
jgi:Family of unknown function (DUF7010)